MGGEVNGQPGLLTPVQWLVVAVALALVVLVGVLALDRLRRVRWLDDKPPLEDPLVAWFGEIKQLEDDPELVKRFKGRKERT